MTAKIKNLEQLDDTELVKLAIGRDVSAIRLITGRYNQRLFRTAWSVLRNHADAEDVVQESYLKAFRAIERFSGQSSLSTWLTRITLNTALDARRARIRRQSALDTEDVVLLEQYRSSQSSVTTATRAPDYHVMKNEFSKILKAAVERLPDPYRMVFVLREIEDLPISEVATILSIQDSTVKSRLFRARRQLRKELEPDFGDFLRSTLPFAGNDCEAMTARILTELDLEPQGENPNE